MKFRYLPSIAAVSLLTLACLPDKTTHKVEYQSASPQSTETSTERLIVVPPELQKRIQSTHGGLTSALIYDYDNDGTKDATLNCKDGSLFVQRDYRSGKNPFEKIR